MSVVHRVVGYDKVSERLARACDVPAEFVGAARRIADAPEDVAEAPGAFPLGNTATMRLSALLGIPMSDTQYDWFLEPFEDRGSAA